MTEFLCRKCNDTGWLTVKKEDGREFAQRCGCQAIDRLLSKSEKANLPGRFAGAELGGYMTREASSAQKRAKKIIEKFITDYPSVDKGLLLQGSVGLGKTRLLCTIATELMKKRENIDIYYIDWNDLVRLMGSGESYANRDFDTINSLVNKLAGVELLLFDEFASTKASPWVYDNIYYLVNKRYNDDRKTIFATNYYDENEKPDKRQESLTQRIGDRLRSRLYEMAATITIKGMDYRQKAMHSNNIN